MKIRKGFVSNSSSSSFIIFKDKKPGEVFDVKDILMEEFQDKSYVNELMEEYKDRITDKKLIFFHVDNNSYTETLSLLNKLEIDYVDLEY